jgi:hypothetical protein
MELDSEGFSVVGVKGVVLGNECQDFRFLRHNGPLATRINGRAGISVGTRQHPFHRFRLSVM